MFIRLSPRTFWILLFVLSGLWLGASVFTVLYGIFSPAANFQEIVRALEMRGEPPLQAASAIQQTIIAVGPMQRAVQVGYYSKVTLTLQLGAKRKEKRTQASYIAWFQKVQKPILLILERNETDGVVQGYVIAEGEPMSIARSFAAKLLLFAFSLYMVIRKRAPDSG